MVGQTLGHYKVLEKLGEGGMGQVYRAEDTTLGREVAIKVLPTEFTADPERLARFEREAKLLASLNHPHIAAIYSFETVAIPDTDAGAPLAGARQGASPSPPLHLLVMELVEGQTLAEHIATGLIPAEDALPIARQIAQALEAAHERGIVHRDLKPANIKLTPGGEVKVLDFGLAKPVTDAASGEITHSPTLTYSPTQAGVLLGTAAYMSPEQARGQEVDKRTDIWAFGVVLWEMLSGKHLFDGDTVSDILAAVLRADLDWQDLPPGTPRQVHRLLRRCLNREPRERLHDIADARLELEEAAQGGQPELEISAVKLAEPTTKSRQYLWALIAIALVAALGWLAWLKLRPEQHPVVIERYQLQPPPGVEVSGGSAPSTLAISPDGRWVAFRGYSRDSSAPSMLYLRSVGELDARPVSGTGGGWNPIFSPDSRWLGFVVDGVLKKVPITGGEPLSICEAPQLRGASWGKDGTILFSARGEGIFRVSAEGGEPEVVALPTPKGKSRDWVLYWPQHLPDGRSAIISIHTGIRESKREIAVLSLESGEYRTVLTGGTFPWYIDTGHLVYSRLGTLYAVPFDLERLEVTGEPTPVIDDVLYYPGSGNVAFAVSESGSLVYQPGAPRVTDSELVWLSRDGSIAPAIEDHRPYNSARLSPDGSRLAVTIFSSVDQADLWIYEIARKNWNRLTDDGYVYAPRWSPDGRWIVFSFEHDGVMKLFRMPVDGSASAEPLNPTQAQWEYPSGLSPDGNVLAFQRQVAPAQWDIWTLPFHAEDPTPEPFLATPDLEAWPVISPGGDWVAYESHESRRREIYVRHFPGPEPKVKISTEGGHTPQWSPDGRELLYRSGEVIWSVPVDTGPKFTAGQPQPLTNLGFRTTSVWDHAFQVSDDGQRFLLIRLPEEQEEEPQRLVYIPDWFDELESLLTTER